jgi:putative DNA methylase
MIKKKLIEVALPLPEINDASAYDKMPGIGPHPKGIHHWWARLPLPTARAVLFASVVDDPSAHPDKWLTEEAQSAERERLFDIVRRLMGKKLHEHPEVYAEARAEMLTHCGGNLPVVFDPFAGGGSIPLEANRFGFEAHAGDLNPVAVLLNKCNLELAPRWAGRAPVNPEDRSSIGGSEPWPGTRGLAADLRYYGQVIRERAESRIGKLYPMVRLPKHHGGGEAMVITWLWARTVASPNPVARGRHVPLVSSFMLSTKKGKEARVEPLLDDSDSSGWRFDVRTGSPTKEQLEVARLGTRAGRAQDFVCLLTRVPIARTYVQSEGKAGRLGQRLMAIVCTAPSGKAYVAPSPVHQSVSESANTDPRVAEARSTFLSGAIPDRAGITGGVCSAYGLNTWGHLFTGRQLVSMLTFSDLVADISNDVERDARSSGLDATEATQYAATIVTFLALALDRVADFNCALSTWKPSGQQQMHLFTRQALPMVWDFAEANVLGEKAICWHNAVDITASAIESLFAAKSPIGFSRQSDAAAGCDGLNVFLVTTDPPYYNNISYAILSDFFYVWLRRTIGNRYPDVFSTVLVPKLPELTASPDRFEGDKHKAKEHFESGFRTAFTNLRSRMDPRFPLTVYYAFKQDDEEGGGPDDEDGDLGVDLTTGWETLLEALISSGFQITATWPVRASQKWRMVSMGANALASYVVLACRPRAADSADTDRRSFVGELKRELPSALRHLQQGNIAPVDFAQAAIGPGMAIYSRHGRILESSGQVLSVRSALSVINQTLTEVLSEQEGDFDADTRWAIAWFEQSGFIEGDFGDANTLATAKNTSVRGMEQAGILVAKGGRVRLLRPEELPSDWDPSTDRRLSIWEMTHHLVRVYFHEKAGDVVAAELLRKIGSRGDIARELAYLLFDLAEKKKRSQEAQAYNALVLGWPEVARLAREGGRTQQPLFG